MARAMRRWNQADGTEDYLYEDGSWVRFKDGEVISRKGPDPDRAAAFASTYTDATAEAIRAGDAWENSAYGRRVIAQEEAAGRRTRQVQDRDYGLRRDDQRYRQEADERDFGLKERDFGLREKELDRRFGLDQQRLGIDFFQTAADYGKTPGSWLDAVQFQSPAFMNNFAKGLGNPAFGATGTPATMNTITDRVNGAIGGAGGGANAMQSGGGGGLANGFVDPAKNVQAILKGSPPSAGSGFTGQDIAAVNLISEIFRNGGQNQKEGAWESYTPDQRALVKGTMDYIQPGGGAFFEQQWAKSRIPGRGSQNPFAA